MHEKAIKIEVTRAEAEALWAAADAGTTDDTIDHLGWSNAKKAAFRRAAAKLSFALRAGGN